MAVVQLPRLHPAHNDGRWHHDRTWAGTADERADKIQTSFLVQLVRCLAHGRPVYSSTTWRTHRPYYTHHEPDGGTPANYHKDDRYCPMPKMHFRFDQATR
ncbi:hypothetical protein KVT40_004166 [Elsinoe batatas]|uniref:Uncharacterized protein n=1 Tax=Elsinoe batatas TaxID=2601811 RepID=A0A8K0L525_9PEZI|nr:hypothetical protein KVT40_004166 [Elsinoe batatas]